MGRKLGIKQAICFAGGQPFGPTWNNFDLFFVESDEYKLKFQAANVDVMTAFGTNTKLYDPKDERLVGQAKLFDVCFPATYAAWKRHKLFSEATQGLRTVCAGYMYDDHETECWKEPQRGGSFVLPHVPASGLRHLLAASRVCLITSETTGGSQRTVLEAMAMDVPVIVMDDSPKTSEYVLDAISKGYKVGAVVPPDPLGIKRAIYEWEDEKANGRQYILDTWSEKNYAEQINLGLNKLVGTR